MDNTTLYITIGASICVGIFSIIVIAGAFYGILVLYPRYRQQRVDELKKTGRQGEATIIRLPEHDLGPQPGRSSMFTMVQIGLEIRVPGLETYEVDKVFTFPTHGLGLLKVGKVVAVWVDPKEPHNLDKIAIDVK